MPGSEVMAKSEKREVAQDRALPGRENRPEIRSLPVMAQFVQIHASPPILNPFEGDLAVVALRNALLDFPDVKMVDGQASGTHEGKSPSRIFRIHLQDLRRVF